MRDRKVPAMMRAIRKPLLGMGAAVLLTAWAGGTGALAEEAGSGQVPSETTAPAETTAPDGSRVYELRDQEESPPVNYRSNEDARYDTQSQHDAEMYAEQYEKKRTEQRIRDKKLLDDLNRFSDPGQLHNRTAPGGTGPR